MADKKLTIVLGVLAVAVVAILAITYITSDDSDGTDYSDEFNWITIEENPTKDVDIFLIYPTVAYSPEPEDDPAVRIDLESHRNAAANWALISDGSVLNDVGNVFAPYYRSANAAGLVTKDKDAFWADMLGTPKDDIFDAFEYYLKHYNNGRPFIIIGHSQGGLHTRELATEYLGAHPEYQNQLVAAYAIGFPVTQEQIDKNPSLRFAESSTDTGVIISWNTTSPSGANASDIAGYFTHEEGALVINPISWNRSEITATAHQGLGARVLQDDGTYKKVQHRIDATVDTELSIIVTSTVNEADYAPSRTQLNAFHSYDIGFFYYDIEENAKVRIASYLERPDYSIASNWIVTDTSSTKDIDVFIVYPTVTFSTDPADNPDVSISNQSHRDLASDWVLNGGGSVLNDVGNVYSPYYRQANVAGILAKEKEPFWGDMLGTPRGDVFDAFDYYIENYNNGRPFIILGWSQGGLLARELATEYVGSHPELYMKLIATYVIGFPVTEEQIAKNPTLKFAEGADDFHVVVSWSTTPVSEADLDHVSKFFTYEKDQLVINPITWTTSETTATAHQSKGAYIQQADGTYAKVEHFADATVDTELGIIITSTVSTDGYDGLPGKLSKFHAGDVDFFYYDIQENAKLRIQAYQGHHDEHGNHHS
jgi:pimeloyl-ACP methyl ester carboxylesterase